PAQTARKVGSTPVTFSGQQVSNQLKIIWRDDATANLYFLFHTKKEYTKKKIETPVFFKKMKIYFMAVGWRCPPITEGLRVLQFAT
ncbi:MAG: hypothetical protein ONB45_08615, partial [candidate division KSB1 bacterium]|nr:hypothetical protein [candidate division KSB1 bacterium]